MPEEWVVEFLPSHNCFRQAFSEVILLEVQCKPIGFAVKPMAEAWVVELSPPNNRVRQTFAEVILLEFQCKPIGFSIKTNARRMGRGACAC